MMRVHGRQPSTCCVSRLRSKANTIDIDHRRHHGIKRGHVECEARGSTLVAESGDRLLGKLPSGVRGEAPENSEFGAFWI